MRRLLPMLLVIAACSEKSPPVAPTATPTLAEGPVDPATVPPAWRNDVGELPPHIGKNLAFVQTMLTDREATMKAVTCYCCGKSLHQCYADTANRTAKACSPL